jgi:hypothetical protein
MSTHRLQRLSGAVVFLSIALGGWLRFSELESKSVSHPEMYVPGIRLPEGLSEPAERRSVQRILTGTLSSDTHPPGYYLLMFPWTRAAGTSLRAMRLPSALLGTACIPLVYVLGGMTVGPAAGAAAAAFLAFSGYHIFWSRVARMFALDCFLGLAATVLLLWIARHPGRSRFWLALYALLMLAGVATHVFFWTFFLVHIIWAFANARGSRQLPDICRTQVMAFLLGSPLIAFAAYQGGTTVALLSRNVAGYLWDFVSFAFVLPSDQSGFFPAAVPFTGSPLFQGIRALLFLFGAFLLVQGVRWLRQTPQPAGLAAARSSRRGGWAIAWIAAAALATIEIALFVYMTRWLAPGQIHPTIATTKRLLVMPAMLAIAAIWLDRRWARLPPAGRITRLLNGERAFVALLGILPFTLLAAAAQLRPLLNQRGMLFASPYFLLLLAAGLASTRRKSWAAAMMLALGVIMAASVVSYRRMTVDPADYTQFAASVTSSIQTGDLVFVRKIWYETPILYYLQPEHFQLVGRGYEEICAQKPEARVWVVLLYDSAPTREMQRALSGYQAVKAITAPHAQAILYERTRKALTEMRLPGSQTFEN